MLQTVEAIINPQGQVRLLEKVSLGKNRKALVTILDEDDSDFDEKDFFMTASIEKMDEIWSNEGDNIYAELLEK